MSARTMDNAKSVHPLMGSHTSQKRAVIAANMRAGSRIRTSARMMLKPQDIS